MSVTELLVGLAALAIVLALIFGVWRRRRMLRRGNRPNIERDT